MSNKSLGLSLALLAGASLAGAPILRAKDAPKPPVKPLEAKNPSEAMAALQQSPDGALRAFLVSMVSANPAAIRQLILPVSDKDFAYLINQTPPAPKERDLLVARIAGMPVRAVRQGEVLTLPGGKKLTVSKDDVGEDQLLLLMPNGPLPYLVLKIKNRWYVDASSIIAGRKAAAQLAKEKAKKAAH